jgi:hypothetical protein
MATVARQTGAERVPWVEEALRVPRGARFLRCALHVNPFDYVQRHSKATAFSNEADYNQAIIEGAQRACIEVIAVVDHYRVKSGASLIAAAEKAGLDVFPGFEAVTKDGVHFLCLFEPGAEIERVDRVIGECGIHDGSKPSPLGKYDALELLEAAERWGALCIAAHVASGGGLLRKLSGQSRVAAWTSERLLAAVLPGPVSDAPQDERSILENRDPNHRRARPVAIINAKDVCAPEELEQPSHSTWIKMSEVSLSGLRQAFLDPESRIRLATDPPPIERTEITAVRWDGGFLDGAILHLSDDLNVLIGGRGAGKSTVVESVRYALDLEPIGEDARQNHEGIVRRVLRSGTRVGVLVHSHRPSPANYVVERTIPNPPSVRNADTGEVLDLTPADIIPGIEVYGQHEISEVARSPERRTRLLRRFVEADPGLARRKAALRRGLEQSRARLIEADRDLKRTDERLASLPGLEETLRRFQEAGVEERLKERSLLVREERTIKTASERLEPFSALLEELREELPVDRAFVSRKALEDLPGRDVLDRLDAILADLSRDIDAAIASLEEALNRAGAAIEEVRTAWDERRQEVEAGYQEILRELQKSHVDGAEFIQLRQQIEELRPLGERLTTLRESRKSLEADRRDLLLEWEDLKGEEFRALAKAAKRVTKRLMPRVRIEVTAGAEREPLFALLREHVGGRLSESCDALRERPDLSLTEFADAWRGGADELQKRFNLPASQAQRIAQAEAEVVMRAEELELHPSADVELNVAREDEPERWQRLDDLSTGQKATAILLLLLLESDAPLVVDQPEDDLDNRFIYEGVVPRMREEKRRRQFIFSTHNANIPVLGDAELIVGLSASGEAEEGQARVAPEDMGSIDMASVRDLVEELLEGGREAFELRRLKYGF